MKILLLETSSELALLATVEEGFVTQKLTLSGGPELSKSIAEELKKILAPPYSRVVVGIGPGSFTGTRVGASLASALAFGWKIPLYTVSSLVAFGSDVAVDARMGGIYVQQNFGEPVRLSLEMAAQALSQMPLITSPHPEKIAARIEGLRLEKREPDPLLLIEHAVPAKKPLQLHYFDVK